MRNLERRAEDIQYDLGNMDWSLAGQNPEETEGKATNLSLCVMRQSVQALGGIVPLLCLSV